MFKACSWIIAASKGERIPTTSLQTGLGMTGVGDRETENSRVVRPGCYGNYTVTDLRISQMSFFTLL